MAAPKQINRALLTDEQKRRLDEWEKFFHGELWVSIVNRFQPEIERLQNSYHTVQGEQDLGRIQGALNIYYRLLIHFPDMVWADFLSVTGQLDEVVEDPSEEDLGTPEDWSR